ncbi:MAG: DUF2971 domain-containing protein [Candidatus Omnitrophica bacterium]|nr:DUF2971 domain-containing protein [Candidatus Omnitrophota bacterium]
MGRNTQSGSTTDYTKAWMYGYWISEKIELYDDALRNILENKNKEFKRTVYQLTKEANNEVQRKIKKLRNANIRVASFSEFDRYENFAKNIQMWAHYADNHRGFCVVYNLSFLKEKTIFSLEDYEYYKNRKGYLDERLKAAIKGGIFPVIYTSNRINVPVTKLKKIKIDAEGDLDHDSDIDAILYKTYIVKSSNWSYEKEWRLILDGNISNFYDNKIPFPYIEKIYLGCRMDNQMIDTMREIGKELNVEVIILKMDNKKFLLEETSTQSYDWRKDMLKLNNPFKKDTKM